MKRLKITPRRPRIFWIKRSFKMITMFKSLAVLGGVAAAGFSAQTARADHVSVGFGVSIAAPVYRAPVVVYRPAPTVVTYAAPTYVYAPTTYAYTPAPVSYPAPVVYASPSYSYYADPCPPVYAPYYSAPVVYSSPGYYVSPSFGFSIGFGGRFGDGHFGGGHDGGGHGHR
jgi:hypothetical protein